MLHVIKLSQDHVPYFSLVLILNAAIQFSAAYMYPFCPHARMRIELKKPLISRKSMKRIFKSDIKLSKTIDEWCTVYLRA